MLNKFNLESPRRDFLRLGIGVASGIVLSAGVGRCSDKDSEQTFVQPDILVSQNGLLDVTLTVSYWNGQLSGEDQATKFPAYLRSYGYNNNRPNYAGPTLVVKGGDKLRILLVNNLPLNPPAAPNDPLVYMKPNTTNLHTHGLHVFPGMYEDLNRQEYGDYVVDSRTGGIVPEGDSRQYSYDIPKNHPAGPFYYRPQFHGSSAIQVASLMQGAIMVRGPVDALLDMAQATELIFLFQAPYFTNGDDYKIGADRGRLENFEQLSDYPTGRGVNRSNTASLEMQPVLINGVRQPTIILESGEVQRWRFINTQIFNRLNISLDDHILYQYTRDGWGSADYQEYPDARKKDGKGIELSAGNRSSVIVKAGAPGTYLLRALPVNISNDKQGTMLPKDVLARVVVVERKTIKKIAEKIPAAPLPVSDFLEPISDDEFSRCGGRKRSIVFNAVVPGGLTNYSGTQPAASQLQRSNPVIQNVILGAVEEWTIFNFNSISHAFHIHVNPMFVTKINDQPIDPYWCDTVALPAGGTPEMPTSVTFRMRFRDFVGPYILQSQMLQYSDLGLIQRVTVVPE
jgi:FtsP/CotA-like multicopper oxidase with cupredoxin domain